MRIWKRMLYNSYETRKKQHQLCLFAPGPPWGQQCGRSSLQVQHTYPRSALQGGARARVPQLQREGSTQHDITLNVQKKQHHEEKKSCPKKVSSYTTLVLWVNLFTDCSIILTFPNVKAGHKNLQEHQTWKNPIKRRTLVKWLHHLNTDSSTLAEKQKLT